MSQMLTQILTDATFMFWTAMTLMVVVSAIFWSWSYVRKAEIDAALKREMIARGYSAGEIARILMAGQQDEEEE